MMPNFLEGKKTNIGGWLMIAGGIIALIQNLMGVAEPFMGATEALGAITAGWTVLGMRKAIAKIPPTTKEGTS